MDDDTGDDRENGPIDQRTPRWVQVFGIIALVVVLIVLGVHLAGGGFRGHMSR